MGNLLTVRSPWLAVSKMHIERYLKLTRKEIQVALSSVQRSEEACSSATSQLQRKQCVFDAVLQVGIALDAYARWSILFVVFRALNKAREVSFLEFELIDGLVERVHERARLSGHWIGAMQMEFFHLRSRCNRQFVNDIDLDLLNDLQVTDVSLVNDLQSGAIAIEDTSASQRLAVACETALHSQWRAETN